MRSKVKLYITSIFMIKNKNFQINIKVLTNKLRRM